MELRHFPKEEGKSLLGVMLLVNGMVAAGLAQRVSMVGSVEHDGGMTRLGMGTPRRRFRRVGGW